MPAKRNYRTEPCRPLAIAHHLHPGSVLSQFLKGGGGITRFEILPSELGSGSPPREHERCFRTLGRFDQPTPARRTRPKVANAMGYLASVLLRALEEGSIEERLAKLETILAKNAGVSEPFDDKSRTNVNSIDGL
jgi:hypothetical protein